MIVRPDEIRARSAPSTSPLKHCDMKAPQLITLPPAASTSTMSQSGHDVPYHEERSANGVIVKWPDVQDATRLFAPVWLARICASSTRTGGAEKANLRQA